MLKAKDAEGIYTHENQEVLREAYRELVGRVGEQVVTLEENKIVIWYPLIAYDTVALPIIEKFELTRCNFDHLK
ncbi:hypothetical protein [Paenibacillus sp. FSL P4-0288]|uniref:hypothetical protein n=1 Tax=Paenibacillus sp. FSL P4-0288 TaxID=2921633 RepID=UPI0030F6EEC5